MPPPLAASYDLCLISWEDPVGFGRPRSPPSRSEDGKLCNRCQNRSQPVRALARPRCLSGPSRDGRSPRCTDPGGMKAGDAWRALATGEHRYRASACTSPPVEEMLAEELGQKVEESSTFCPSSSASSFSEVGRSGKEFFPSGFTARVRFKSGNEHSYDSGHISAKRVRQDHTSARGLGRFPG